MIAYILHNAILPEPAELLPFGITRVPNQPSGKAMTKFALLSLAAAMLTAASAASAQSLTEQQARAAIAPWYSLFNVAGRGDVRAIQEQILTEDYQSCSGYLPGECWGRDTSIKVVSNFASTIPDMRFDIKEMLVAGDRVIVRGEVTGTPSGELFGVPHSGKSFRMMAIDIQTIKDGRITKTFHMENWLSAIGQLRAK
jgi:ketosteroid isomerase-like protein